MRVMGLCFRADKLLLVQQQVPQQSRFWLPPGGGVQFGERQEEALRREFREETGLEVSVLEFARVSEFIQPPFHAIELIYRVAIVGGKLTLGKDPEHPEDKQLIRQVAFLSHDEIKRIPSAQRHSLLQDPAWMWEKAREA